jgi:hypothetical protein
MGAKCLLEHCSFLRRIVLNPLCFAVKDYEALLGQVWSEDAEKRAVLNAWLMKKVSMLVERIEMLLESSNTSHLFACAMMMCRAKFFKERANMGHILGSLEYFGEFCE